MTHSKLSALSAAITTLIVSTSTFATDLGEGLGNGSDAVLLNNQDGHYKRWNGIGKLFLNDAPGCTASLLDTRDENARAVGPAYLLTAAHCVPGVIRSALTPADKYNVKFNYFNDTPTRYKTHAIKGVVWKDFELTDLAIMELDVELQALINQGITPLALASQWSKDATDVLIVGAPEGLERSGLRLAACTQGPTEAELVEGDRVALKTLKNSCRDIRPGSSGSPVLDRQSGEILSVMSTSTYGAIADEQCFNNAPCEVKNGTIVWSPDTHYSSAADYLMSCFSEGVFNKDSNLCKSDAPFQLTELKYWPTQYLTMPKNAASPDPVLNAQFSLSTPYYRFKTVREVADCSSARNYSGTLDAKDVVLDTPISRVAGMHYLCVIGVESAEQRPTADLMKNAWITPAQLVERAPVRPAEPTITLGADWNYRVTWHYRIPTHFGVLYYAGPAADTDCSQIKIADYSQTFEAVTFMAEQLPLKLCSRNQDLSDRYSDVRTDLLALP
ncbi:trypsin-like peptidase domain-containing protein [Pseudomonas sp. C1C7]|uniref:trypsin-like serine peptidase n=1 Tax=Pseudomonas sp. C1C7 TaxID=2735272 RepID=UPI001586A7BF|nr:serine protease [Pseudomonas sp. C1C7]NUT75923.1 trypsin-like peptidase domain-containing protein [Pseudomonas sp. C1C7]